MLKRFKTVDLLIDGETVRAPIVRDLTIHEIGEEMDKVAAQMGYWANVLGAAIEERDAADAAYRNWRAMATEDILLDPETAKLSEWKVKNRLESTPEFMEHKATIARCKRNVETVDRIFQAFDKKGNQLQSRGANLRGEFEKTGMVTRTRAPDDDDDDDDDEREPEPGSNKARRKKRKDKVRGIFSGKRKKAKG